MLKQVWRDLSPQMLFICVVILNNSTSTQIKVIKNNSTVTAFEPSNGKSKHLFWDVNFPIPGNFAEILNNYCLVKRFNNLDNRKP